jgi:DNA-binding winged helix-turn-helix (wHTH) protein/TolB-like protein/Tfp pilus assembly protein PilF
MPNAAPAETIRFGAFELDLRAGELRKDGARIKLHNQPFQVLTLLIEHPGQIVTREELRQRLWGSDTFVDFDVGLNSAIKKVRDALGDSTEAPRFIETVPRRGYRFIGHQVSEPAAPLRPRLARWTVAAIVLVAVAGVTLLIVTKQQRAIRAPHPIRSLAILPFDTAGADPSHHHLGLGLPDLLITRLSNVRQLIIRPTSAVRGFAARGVTSLEAGRMLRVDAVLEGSIRTTPDRVRVTVQLLNVLDQKTIWAGEFDQKRSDVFMIEDAISEQVADALMIQLSPGERIRLTKRYTTDSQAYELYIQAKFQEDQFSRFERSDLNEAIGLLEQAVQKDPSYAIAWANLAQFYGISAEFAHTVQPQFAYEKAKAAANKALQLDDELSEAHSAAGFVKMYSDLDYAGAEREFVRALELNPRNWLGLMTYGRLLQCLGRFDEAIELRKRHVEIDPLNPTVHGALAAAYLTARKDELGIQECHLIVRMDPNISQPHASLARIYTVRGEYDKAIAEAREAVRTDHDYGQSLQSLALLGHALGMSGRKDQASEILRQIENDKRGQPFDLAIVHLALGHRDEVFRILEKAVDQRSYVLRLKTEQIFEPLHSDPRFKALLRRAGFEG